MNAPNQTLKQTPLHSLHENLGGKMVPFAGYAMAVQYEGILAEHKQTRGSAGLFDVSHMGQAFLVGPSHEATAAALESITPGNIQGLALGHQRYTLLLNETGGIIDDLMVTRSASPEDDGRLMLVVNAARKEVDYAFLEKHLSKDILLEPVETRALLALQGPKAGEVMDALCPQAAALTFMQATSGDVAGFDAHISRSGYTGEDGFEISIPAENAEAVARAILDFEAVAPIGLGARDSLRLEAGLCLYGHDINEETSPIEAALNWAIPKRRREEANFPGASRIMGELAEGPARVRVGLLPEGRAPAREGTEITDAEGNLIGAITSGTFSPSLERPIAMGYVAAAHKKPGSKVTLLIRGKEVGAEVTSLPFVPQNYKKN